MTQHVLLVGATGSLGHRIALHLLDAAEVDLRLLVRPGALADPTKAATLSALTEHGASVVEGDLGDAAALESATSGIDVVISAVQGGADVIVDGQLALGRAAATSGVTRFIPSDYALDLFHAPVGAPMFDQRRKAAAGLEALDLDVVHVLNGAFMDMMLDPRTAGVVDLEQRTGQFWGDGDDEFDVTLIEDVAAFTARLAVDPATEAGSYAISGSRTSFDAIITAVEDVLGEPLERHQRGTLADLRRTVETATNPWAAIGAWYNLSMLTTPPFTSLVNDRYPDVRPTTLEDYLRATLAHRVTTA